MGRDDRCRADADDQDAPGRARWRCAGCECDDPAMLKENGDSSLVCTACGVVAHAATLVSLARQKNCRAEDARRTRPTTPTPTADRLGPIHGDGVESADEARKRRQRQQLSTRIGAPRSNRADGRSLCAAHERACKAAAARAASPRARARAPAPEAARWPLHDHAPHALEAKGRKVATAVAMLWKHNAPGRDRGSSGACG